jgi:hypothetical protein
MHSFLYRRKIGKKVERASGENVAMRRGQVSGSGKGRHGVFDCLDSLE